MLSCRDALFVCLFVDVSFVRRVLVPTLLDSCHHLSSLVFSLLLIPQMIEPRLKLDIEHILTPQEYPTNPHVLEFEDNAWKDWLDLEKAVYVNWRFKGDLPETSRLYLG